MFSIDMISYWESILFFLIFVCLFVVVVCVFTCCYGLLMVRA